MMLLNSTKNEATDVVHKYGSSSFPNSVVTINR